MIAMGFLHNFAFNSEEKATIAEWKVWDRSSVTEAAMSEYVKRYARNVPGTFDPAKDACPGLDKRGVMADRGLLFLNVDSNHTGIDVSFRVNEAILKAPRKVRLTVRDYAGNSTSVSTVIKEPSITCAVPLPRQTTGRTIHRLYEIGWEFDYVAFDGPYSRCNATMLRVSSH